MVTHPLAYTIFATLIGLMLAAPTDTNVTSTPPASPGLNDATVGLALDGANTTSVQPLEGTSMPHNNVLSLALPAESYKEGVTCGAGSGVWADIQQFRWNTEIFCTTIDDWVLTRDTMVSTPLAVDLLNTNAPKKPGSPGYITFAFVNHGSDRPISMTYRACQRVLSKLACHKCGGDDCTGAKNMGTKGGVVKDGDMTLSAWLHKGDIRTPHLWT